MPATAASSRSEPRGLLRPRCAAAAGWMGRGARRGRGGRRAGTAAAGRGPRRPAPRRGSPRRGMRCPPSARGPGPPAAHSAARRGWPRAPRHIRAPQALELDALHRPYALPAGDQWPQRMAAVQLVGAEADDHEHATAWSARTSRATRSSVDRSAQCRSSMTNMSGRSAASRWITPTTSSSRRAVPPSPSGVVCSALSGSSSGSTCASSERAGPMKASSSSGDVSRMSERNTCASGPNGRPSPPISMQLPARTLAPASLARSAASSTRRVLPTPASPLTSTTAGSPATAASSAAIERSTSASRPTIPG